MKIEFLYVLNCPNHAVALERLREILAGESLEAHLNEVLVCSVGRNGFFRAYVPPVCGWQWRSV